MIFGIGNDIISVERIRGAIERHQQHFLDRVFSPREQKYCLSHRDPQIRFAGRFAGKEAVAKALGTGFSDGISWLDIEILNNPNGKPYVSLSPRINSKFSNPQIQISISHCDEYANSVAIWSD